jgi:hypothetical protein
MVALSAAGLRKIAGYLETLTGAAREYDIEARGHSGYTEITLKTLGGPDVVLRVVPVPPRVLDDGTPAPVEYCLEVEVS